MTPFSDKSRIFMDRVSSKSEPKNVLDIHKKFKMVSYAKHFTFVSVSNCNRSQCGKFSIFLSLRFYVKSILENVEVLKNAIFATSETVNFSFG